MAKRLSVSLDSDDERMVRAFRSSTSPERAALLEWAASRGFEQPASDLRHRWSGLCCAPASNIYNKAASTPATSRSLRSGPASNTQKPAKLGAATSSAPAAATSVRDPLRGQVYGVNLGHGAKPWLVVSNNQRNHNLESVIAARITTTSKNARLPTVVPLATNDPLTGHVLCDDLVPLYRDELADLLGALTRPTMQAVSAGLRVALP